MTVAVALGSPLASYVFCQLPKLELYVRIWRERSGFLVQAGRW